MHKQNQSDGPSYLADIKEQEDVRIENEFAQADEEWRAFTEEKLNAGAKAPAGGIPICVFSKYIMTNLIILSVLNQSINE